MNINRVQVTIEPWKWASPNAPTVTVLRIKIEKWPGEEIHLEKVLPDDDLHSLWDYLWKEMGKTLEQTMEVDE